MARTIRAAVLSTMSLVSVTLAASSAFPTVWTVIAVDPKGDVRDSSGIDIAQLSYRYERSSDRLWIRLAFFTISASNELKIELAIESGDAGARRATWSGAEFTFDRLATAHVSTKSGAHHASLTVRDAGDPDASRSVLQDTSDVIVAEKSIAIGIKRASLLGSRMKMNLIAAIGSDETWNDDIPNAARPATIDLTEQRRATGLREIDTSRNNLRFSAGQRILGDAAAPPTTRTGHGPRTLILIPGSYSGATVFDGFIARNEASYTFHVMTPPGLNGTAARRLPRESASVGDYTWTRQLARDIRDLIVRKHLDKPIVVAHGFPGTLAAEELAVGDPDLLGGIVEIAGMPPQFFPSGDDPRRQATPAERVAAVDESWLPFWFKHVTPETWEANNYPSEMFANDPARGERARQQVESAPLPVKIRYLVENMASDHRADLGALRVPLMALIPGFDGPLLSNPRFAWFKTSFQDAWDQLRQPPRLEFTTIPDARVLMLDDQPARSDAAIARFVERHEGRSATHQS
jgi:pimeloyl-ACP methyl ester carboxylesterase